MRVGFKIRISAIMLWLVVQLLLIPLVKMESYALGGNEPVLWENSEMWSKWPSESLAVGFLGEIPSLLYEVSPT